MSRTNDDAIRDIIDVDTDKPLVSMSAFIRAAATLVDKISSNDSASLLSAPDLREIETWLAAHFYAHKDMQYSSSKAGEAFSSFQTGARERGPLNMTMWGKTAMILDVTGYLSVLNQDAIRGKSKITLEWLGKAPSAQTDYTDRD